MAQPMESKYQKRVGLAVMRCQPLHRGHIFILNEMVQDCQTAILCLGSAQKSREPHDPFTVEERMQMVRNVFGDRIKIVPLNDLGAARPEDWTNYIFTKLEKLGMKTATDYYTGSVADSHWYKHAFFLNGVSPITQDQHLREYDPRDGSELLIGRRLHIINREGNPVPPATDVRTFLSLRNENWKQWVPPVNWKLVADNYPDELKVPLKDD